MNPDELNRQWVVFRTAGEVGGGDAYFANLFEAVGFDKVKAAVMTGDIGSSANRSNAQRWVSEIERKQTEERDRINQGNVERSLAAAERSAAGSLEAARQARLAAFISLASVLVNLAIAWYKGELPWPF